MISEYPLLLPQVHVLVDQCLLLHQTQLLHSLQHIPLSLSYALSLLLQQLDFLLDSASPLDSPQLLLIVLLPVMLMPIGHIFVVILKFLDLLPFLPVFFLNLLQILPQLTLDIFVFFVDVLDVVDLVVLQILAYQF